MPGSLESVTDARLPGFSISIQSEQVLNTALRPAAMPIGAHAMIRAKTLLVNSSARNASRDLFFR
ncbi:hypothetical protein [Noviherbaspirillum humi]|uniref:hypothetical protein n=1 Tax=Noviherbaspirillum humi TaxID=1688639 RepID=UPI000B76BF82|nr:hypothetical protein [Noviherbaspirillum humi]